MKKCNLILTLGLLAALPVFGATISIERVKPAEVDISKAKSLAIDPTIIARNKFTSDQTALGKVFVNTLEDYASKDGNYVIYTEGQNADVIIKSEFVDFRVHDDGVTLTQKVDGEVNIIKDSWTRAIGGEFKFSVLDGKTGAVLYTKSEKFLGGDSNSVPKDQLRDPIVSMRDTFEKYAYFLNTLIFDMKIHEPISIMDSKSKDKELKGKVKDVYKIVKGKDYKTAKAAYKEIYDATEDTAAGFNYARMAQILYEFDEAESLLLKLQEADPKDKTIKQALKSLEEDRKNYTILESRK